LSFINISSRRFCCCFGRFGQIRGSYWSIACSNCSLCILFGKWEQQLTGLRQP